MIELITINNVDEMKQFMRYCFSGYSKENYCGGVEEITDIDDWATIFGLEVPYDEETEDLDGKELCKIVVDRADLTYINYPGILIYSVSNSFDRMGDVIIQVADFVPNNEVLSVDMFEKKRQFMYDNPFKEFNYNEDNK